MEHQQGSSKRVVSDSFKEQEQLNQLDQFKRQRISEPNIAELSLAEASLAEASVAEASVAKASVAEPCLPEPCLPEPCLPESSSDKFPSDRFSTDRSLSGIFSSDIPSSGRSLSSKTTPDLPSSNRSSSNRSLSEASSWQTVYSEYGAADPIDLSIPEQPEEASARHYIKRMKEQYVRSAQQSGEYFKHPWERIAEQIIEQLPKRFAHIQREGLLESIKPLREDLIPVRHMVDGLVVGRVVAIDSRLKISDPDYALPVNGSPARANNHDAVLVHQDELNFSIRWKPAEPVDPDVIRFWNDADRFELDVYNLKRIKIYGLPFAPLHNLLHYLRNNANLLELHIGTMELPSHRGFYYPFQNLECLSIDAVRLVDSKTIDQVDEGTVIAQPMNMSMAFFVVPKCKAIYLGSNSDSHVSVQSPTLFLMVADYMPEEARLKSGLFNELRVLVCNRLSTLIPSNLAAVFELPHLIQLHLNVSGSLRSTSFQPAEDELAAIRYAYECLVAFYERKRIPSNLCVFVHGVQLDFSKPFTLYGFHRKLIRHRFSNEIKHELDLQPCYSVLGVDFEDFHNLHLKLKKINPRLEPTLISQKFREMYPCVQIVRLVCNDTSPRRPLQEDIDFFLCSCSGLTELEISGPRYMDNAFCNTVFMEYSSCETLRSLKLFSPFNMPQDPLNLEFLPFLQNLRVFQTNLATRSDRMFIQVQNMRIGQEFRFRFQTQLAFYQDFDFKRIDDSKHELLARRWSAHLQEYQELGHFKETSFERIVYLFQAGELAEFSRNWLDPKEPRPQGPQ